MDVHRHLSNLPATLWLLRHLQAILKTCSGFSWSALLEGPVISMA